MKGLFLALVAALATSALACETPPANVPRPENVACGTEFGREASFVLDRGKLKQEGATEESLAKLDASAHRYSRLLATESAARTCLEFRDVRWHLPSVAIHGDAHLEQFASTPETFGLEDFDEAGFGPAIVDMVRFATSIHLACREVGFACDPEKGVDAFFRAYREGIDHPVERKLPVVATRMRNRVPQDNHGWLAWTHSLGEELSPAQEKGAREGWQTYIKSLGGTEYAGFHDIVWMRRLHMGVGSGLESKYLFRVKGPTEAEDDDAVLEARVAEPPSTSGCTYRPAYGGALYMLTFIAVLGSRMPIAFSSVNMDPKPGAHEYWVQRWEPGYTELALSDIQSQAELEELVTDGAHQLSGYFWTRFPETLRQHQRLAGLMAFDMTDKRARVLAKKLAGETLEGWQKFRAAR